MKYISLEDKTEETPDEGSGDQQEDATTESDDSSTTEDPIIFPSTTSPDDESISDSGKNNIIWMCLILFSQYIFGTKHCM